MLLYAIYTAIDQSNCSISWQLFNFFSFQNIVFNQDGGAEVEYLAAVDAAVPQVAFRRTVATEFGF